MKKTLQTMLIALVAIMMPIGAWAEETITHPLTIPSTEHTTLYLGFNAEIPEGITAYIVTEVSMSGGIKLEKFEGSVIPANKGVVIEGGEGTYNFNYTSSPGEMPANNLLEGSLYEKTLEEGNSVYILAEKDGVNIWEKATVIPANNAYLELPASEYGNQASLCFSAHSFDNGECSVCEAVCTHPSIENAQCTTCKMTIEAKWGASKDALTGSGTLQDAFDAASAENSTVGYIQLQNNINSVDVGYTIRGGTFTLDLNGKELVSNTNTLDLLTCTVTLTDNSAGGGGKVVSTGGDSYSIWLNNDGVANLTIEKGRYEGAGSAVIFVDGSGRLTINGGEFAAYEDAVQTNIVYCSEAASLTITGGSFDAERFNYAITTFGTTTISGGTFTNSLFATIDYNGGSLQLEGNVTGMTVNYYSEDNRDITLQDGYNFYNADGEQKEIEELEYDNIYTISKLFKISFAAGEGASGEMAEEEGAVLYTLPVCGFTAPEGKMFDAWKVGDGETTYQPYERIMLTSDITLTALWADYKPQIIIRMFDGSGDGWTGSAIVVKNSNEDEGTTYTIDYGRVSIIKIDYDNTKDYLFYWSYNEDESYPYECSFQILVDGEEVYSAADGDTEDATNYCYDFQDGQLVYGIMVPSTEKVINDGEVALFEVLGYTKVGTLTYNRTLPNLTWNALYVPFEIPMTAMESYDVAYINDVHSYDKDGNGTIDAMDMEVIKIMSGTLNANYPYLIRAKNESAKSMNINLTDATLYKTEHNGVFCSSVFTEFNVYGTYEQKKQEDNPDILAIGGDGSWHKLAEGTTLNPFRLYLKIEAIERSPVKVEESAASKIRIKVWGEDGDATGIEDNCELGVTSEELGVRSEEYYDLQGRRVKNPTKGLYIINGKKVNLP